MKDLTTLKTIEMGSPLLPRQSKKNRWRWFYQLAFAVVLVGSVAYISSSQNEFSKENPLAKSDEHVSAQTNLHKAQTNADTNADTDRVPIANVEKNKASSSESREPVVVFGQLYKPENWPSKQKKPTGGETKLADSNREQRQPPETYVGDAPKMADDTPTTQRYTNVHIRNKDGLCLRMRMDGNNEIEMFPCDKTDKGQVFTFDPVNGGMIKNNALNLCICKAADGDKKYMKDSLKGVPCNSGTWSEISTMKWNYYPKAGHIQSRSSDTLVITSPDIKKTNYNERKIEHGFVDVENMVSGSNTQIWYMSPWETLNRGKLCATLYDGQGGSGQSYELRINPGYGAIRNRVGSEGFWFGDEWPTDPLLKKWVSSISVEDNCVLDLYHTEYGFWGGESTIHRQVGCGAKNPPEAGDFCWDKCTGYEGSICNFRDNGGNGNYWESYKCSCFYKEKDVCEELSQQNGFDSEHWEVVDTPQIQRDDDKAVIAQQDIDWTHVAKFTPPSSVDYTQSITLSTTSEFHYTIGLGMTVGTEVTGKGKVPLLGEGDVSTHVDLTIEGEIGQTWDWSKDTTQEQTFTCGASNIEPILSVDCYIGVLRAESSIPFSFKEITIMDKATQWKVNCKNIAGGLWKGTLPVQTRTSLPDGIKTAALYQIKTVPDCRDDASCHDPKKNFDKSQCKDVATLQICPETCGHPACNYKYGWTKCDLVPLAKAADSCPLFRTGDKKLPVCNWQGDPNTLCEATGPFVNPNPIPWNIEPNCQVAGMDKWKRVFRWRCIGFNA